MAWGFGTTEYLECPKCDAINKVPLEPTKKYETHSQPPSSQGLQPR